MDLKISFRTVSPGCPCVQGGGWPSHSWCSWRWRLPRWRRKYCFTNCISRNSSSFSFRKVCPCFNTCATSPATPSHSQTGSHRLDKMGLIASLLNAFASKMPKSTFFQSSTVSGLSNREDCLDKDPHRSLELQSVIIVMRSGDAFFHQNFPKFKHNSQSHDNLSHVHLGRVNSTNNTESKTSLARAL